ncbi:hypothetical protein BJ322DRAFT_182478 [Thelephora terrestris]|uniref:F-box domain-containing protein n=1 Tax=Thelephora terrestris TaxID=56493 RepID=A0A9P6L5E6_9AGAM|nr:hypothetical protein BJ322DRAFT_182478 [Thelephora terrestris]
MPRMLLSLPLELILEILSYFTDHRSFIRENYNGRGMYALMGKEHAERSIIIRRLTMTCRPLRNRLLPLLWADTEGCVSHTSYDYTTGTGGGGLRLYAQCIYLSKHRAIAAHVRIFPVDLSFFHAPEELVTKFVDCLVRLPNLKTLEILSAGSRAPISKALKRKYAVFPSIL